MSTKTPLSVFEHHALEALKNTSYSRCLSPSSVGQTLWHRCDPKTRKSHPSPQGLALFAAKYLRGLAAAGLAHQHDGWYITAAGSAELRNQTRESNDR